MALAYDFLCRHHTCDDFDCGNPTLNEEIRAAVRSPVDPARVLFIVAHDDNRIRGFVTMADVTVVLEDDGRTRFCFMLPSWARDQTHTKPGVASRLIKEATDILVGRQGRKPYEAVVATSMYTSMIEKRLTDAGFQRCPLESMLWFRFL